MKTVNDFLDKELYPKLLSFVSEDDYVVVIGGSYSFGMADEYSDVDIFLLWNVEPNIWAPIVGNILCRPHTMFGCEFQIVPINITHKRNTTYYDLFNVNENLLNQSSIYDLFNISTYIVLHDNLNRVGNAQMMIKNVKDDFWQDQCYHSAADLIDVLESFYDASKRKDELTLIMYFGTALQKLLELFILSNRELYPQPKWLWRFIKKIDVEMYNKYYLSKFSDLSNDKMVEFIKNMAEDVSKKLLMNNFVKDYIAESLVNP